MKNKHTHRYIARLIMEAVTPLFVGSGQSSFLTDALVQKDINGFPLIPGTSLAGVLRHSFNNEEWCFRIFGDSSASEKGNGSVLKVSSAYMMLNEKEVSEGIMELNQIKPETVEQFNNLPSRQHVRINEKGVAVENGLFDNEVVYKGVRFVFEIELRGTAIDKDIWDAILGKINSNVFRIGAGTRNGYGSLKIMALSNKAYNLEMEDDFNAYLNFNPSFNVNLPDTKVVPNQLNDYQKGYIHYQLNLKPDDFFVFSEGFGDDDADNKPLKEEVVTYSNGSLRFENQTVIPATSVKGAIAHRTAFHYNRLKKQFADEGNGTVGSYNKAVTLLFGKAGEKVDGPQAGNVYINDWYYTDNQIDNDKIFNHVAIDRFTGGAMVGILFSEKVSNLKGNNFCFDVYVKQSALLTDDKNIAGSLEESLKDIAKGLLPLGGMTTKGHGVFTGTVLKNGLEIYNYNTKNEI